MSAAARGAALEGSAALSLMLAAADEAASIIERIYGGTFDVEYKGKGNDDPVTKADREANALICDILARAFPGVPIVAEESDPSSFEGYRHAREVFFVDPLDGTREFVARNGEFCVMIGLAQEGRATAGVIHCPALKRTFGGCPLGSFEVNASGARTPISVSKASLLRDARIVASRTQRPEHIVQAEESLGVKSVTLVGSSGVKAARVACGEAEIYAHPGRAGMLWDICAPDAIVTEAGGTFTDGSGARFDYRTADLQCTNGVFATNGLVHREILEKLARVASERRS